ncbi:MAG TPA: helix-turn-helix domain-containing protein [Acidimicrobiales bacterium]|nr:helix-turn-helix domain-containing protein [Acidimicrobiales bacterium]
MPGPLPSPSSPSPGPAGRSHPPGPSGHGATRSWRGVPLDARRSERRSALVAAAYELLGAHGWPGTTVRAVCQTARLNPRYFYESFDSLESLLIAVFDELVAEATRTALGAMHEAGDEPAARAVAMVEAVVAFVTDDPRRARILFVEAQGNVRLGRRRLDTMAATAEFLERHLWRQTPHGHDRMGLVASHLLVGGLSELVVTWLDGRLDITLSELVRDTTALMVAVGAGALGTARARGGSGTGRARA